MNITLQSYFRKKSTALFLAKFFFIFLLFQFFVLIVNISFLENSLAELEANWLELPFSGNRIFTENGAFSITPNCTGVVSAIILGAIVFGLKKPDTKNKARLWVVGAAALFILNLARLYGVLWVGKLYGIELAETVHVLSWFLTALFIIVIWLFLTKKIAKVKDLQELIE